MEIILYKTTSEKNKINKTLTNEISMTGSLKSETSVVNPSILIKAENPSQYSYAYIPEFGRYYFINDMFNIRQNLWQIDLDVDVLFSYKNEIFKLNGIISKQYQPSNSNDYINDGSHRYDVRQTLETIQFPNGFNETGEYILITAGSD